MLDSKYLSQIQSAQLTPMADSLESTVIAGGYCVGCGLCAVLPDDNYTMCWTENGTWQAERKGYQKPEDPYLRICPFSSVSVDEDQIARELFAGDCLYDPKIGYYKGLYAGYVNDLEYRRAGSSGGLTSWVLEKALETGFFDGIIHVQPASNHLFEYRLVYHSSDLRVGRKSHYYPVEFSKVLYQALADNSCYAVVGVPCFIKAIRLGQRENPVWREKFRLLVSLVCGHLKSAFYAQMLAWQVGILPAELAQVDFRVKLPGQSAKSYGFKAVGSQGVERVRPVAQLFGINWGYGLFKYQACDYCDDVIGETADISFGDAWLPEYVSDEHGTNIVVVRNAVLQQWLVDAHADGIVHIEQLSPEKIFKSQEGSYRHRREGLAYRLYLASRAGKWIPRKRVLPSSTVGTKRFRRIIEARIVLREQSFSCFRQALQSGRWDDFAGGLEEPLRQYQRLYASGGGLFRRGRRLLGLIKSQLIKLLKKLQNEHLN